MILSEDQFDILISARSCHEKDIEYYCPSDLWGQGVLLKNAGYLDPTDEQNVYKISIKGLAKLIINER